MHVLLLLRRLLHCFSLTRFAPLSGAFLLPPSRLSGIIKKCLGPIHSSNLLSAFSLCIKAAAVHITSGVVPMGGFASYPHMHVGGFWTWTWDRDRPCGRNGPPALHLSYPLFSLLRFPELGLPGGAFWDLCAKGWQVGVQPRRADRQRRRRSDRGRSGAKPGHACFANQDRFDDKSFPWQGNPLSPLPTLLLPQSLHLCCLPACLFCGTPVSC